MNKDEITDLASRCFGSRDVSFHAGSGGKNEITGVEVLISGEIDGDSLWEFERKSSMKFSCIAGRAEGRFSIKYGS